MSTPPDSSSPGRVIIIGGGVIGTACAYFLQKSGWRATIVERGAFGHGSSWANCGLVCPSHVLPLAEPGAVGKTLGTLVLVRYAGSGGYDEQLAVLREVVRLIQIEIDAGRDLINRVVWISIDGTVAFEG